MNPNSSNLSLQSGKNFAPAKPLVELRDKNPNEKANLSHYITDALRERYEHHMAEDKENFEDLAQVGHLTSLFIQGKQNLKWNKFAKNFYSVPVKKQGSEKIRTTPIMRFYTTNCESRYMSSNPKILVTPAMEDDKVRQSAKGASVIVDHFERKNYTNWFNRVEALHLMSFGTQINQIRWDSGKQGFKAFRRIFEERNIPVSKGAGQCFDCGHTGTGEEYYAKSEQFAFCPNCDSGNAYAEPPQTQIMQVEVGRKQVNLGTIAIKQLEFPACRWDLRYKAEESSRFIYEQMIALGAIRNLLGDVQLPEDKKGSGSFGLDVIESLARAGMPVGGNTSTDDQVKSQFYKEKVKLTEYYLSAEEIADIKIRGDERTLSGGELPQGKTLAEVFPEGISAVGLNGMQVLLGLYGRAAHKRELTTGTWHQRQFSGAGQGVSDAVDLQKRYNETDSQGYLAMKMNATPGVGYIEGSIEKEYVEFIGKPDVAYPINIPEGMENFRSIEQIIGSPRVGQIDTGILSYQSQNLQNMMQMAMHVTSFSGGLPGVNNKTATGAQIGEANAASLFGPMLGVKTDVRVRAAEIFVNLYVENVPVAQYFPLKSKYGAQQGVYLSGADLATDLIYGIVENSQLPKTQYSIREDIDRFMMAVGGGQGFIAIKQADPEFADELTQKYGIDFETNHFDEVAQICRERFESAKKVLKQIESIESAMSQLLSSVQNSVPDAANEYIPTQLVGDTYEPQMKGNQVEPGAMAESQQPMPPAEMMQPNQPQAASPGEMPLEMPSPEKIKAMQALEGITPTLSKYETMHLEKAEWFASFLDTDEGRHLDAQMREIVYLFIESHFVLGGERQMLIAGLQGQIELAGAMPGQIADVQKQQLLAANNPQN